MAASDVQPFPVKNQILRLPGFPILDATTGVRLTGAAGLDSEVSKDGGAFVDCTNEATEFAGNPGWYFLELTAAEMNADNVCVQIKSTLGVEVLFTILTNAITDVQAGLATSASMAAMWGAVQADVDDIQARLPAALVAGRMSSQVGAMGADVVTAAAVAPDTGAEIATAVWDGFSVTEPAAGAAAYPTSPKTMLARLYQKFFIKRNMTTGGVETQRNAADTVTLWTQQHANDGTTYTQGKAL